MTGIWGVAGSVNIVVGGNETEDGCGKQSRTGV